MARGSNDDLTISLEIESEGGRLLATVKGTEEAIGKLGMTTAKTGRATEKTTQATNQYNVSLRKLDTTVAALRTGFVGLGAVWGVGQIAELTRNMLEATFAFEGAENRLKLLTGSSVGASQELSFLRAEASRLGIEFEGTIDAYTGLVAATRDTALAGEQTREIFSAVSEAGAVMGLSNDDLTGTFRALTQIMSKGTVQSEEIRGQIGERLPGAFQIAARAMEMTTQELGKQLELGNVYAEDFLPRFAQQLREEMGAGVEDVAARLRASFANLTNAFFDLGVAIGNSGVAKLVAAVAQGLADMVGWIQQTLQGVGLLRDMFRSDLPNNIAETSAEIERLTEDLRILNEALTEEWDVEAFRRTQEIVPRIEELKAHARLLEVNAKGTLDLGRANAAAAKETEELTGWLVEERDVLAEIDQYLDDAVREKERNLEADKAYVQALEEQVINLHLTNEEQKRHAMLSKLSADATEDQKEAVRQYTEIILNAKEANTEFVDTINLVATGFNSLDEAWSNTVGNILNGVSRLIAQFQALERMGPWRELTNMQRLSGLAAGFGMISTGAGFGRQIGGTAGGIGGGALGGALAGGALFGVPGALLGALGGGILGGLFGGGGGEREPHTRVFLRSRGDVAGPGPLVTPQPRGDFRIAGASRFGGFAFSTENEVPGDVINSLRDVVVTMGALDDAIGENLSVDQIEAITAALEDFSAGGQELASLPIEQAFQERLSLIFGTIDESLGEFFDRVTGGADIAEMTLVADAINRIIGRNGVFADVSGTMETINVLMGEFAERGETLPEVMGRVAESFALLQALGIGDELTTDLARFAESLIDVMGGFEQASRQIAQFDAIFGRTQSGLEATAAELEAALEEAFSEISLDLDPENLITLDQFNRAFQGVVDSLTPEEVAAWIEAGLTLNEFTGVMGDLNAMIEAALGDVGSAIEDADDAAEDAADDFDDLGDSLDDAAEAARELAQAEIDRIIDNVAQTLEEFETGLTGVDLEIYRVQRQADEWIAQLQELGATEEEIAQIEAWRAITSAQLRDAEAERLALEQERLNLDALSDAQQELELMEEELALRQELLRTFEDNLDVGALWARQNESAIETLRRTASALKDAERGFDGSLEGLQALDAASAAWRDAALTVLADIQAAQETIESTVGRSAEGLRLEGMSQEEQYDYYRRQAEALAASLRELEDPAEIAAVVAEIDRLANAALGLADPAQRAAMREEFISFFDEVGTIASTRLQGIEQDVIEAGDTFSDVVVPVLESSMRNFRDSVDRMRDTVERLNEIVQSGQSSAVGQSFAADKQLDAARLNVQAAQTPVRVTVSSPVINGA